MYGSLDNRLQDSVSYHDRPLFSSTAACKLPYHKQILKTLKRRNGLFALIAPALGWGGGGGGRER